MPENPGLTRSETRVFEVEKLSGEYVCIACVNCAYSTSVHLQLTAYWVAAASVGC